MVQAGPELVPQLPQTAEDLDLIAQAESKDVAVPAEEHEVPRLLHEQETPFALGRRPSRGGRRIEDPPAFGAEVRLHPGVGVVAADDVIALERVVVAAEEA